jgi:hypothetical protein
MENEADCIVSVPFVSEELRSTIGARKSTVTKKVGSHCDIDNDKTADDLRIEIGERQIVAAWTPCRMSPRRDL